MFAFETTEYAMNLKNRLVAAVFSANVGAGICIAGAFVGNLRVKYGCVDMGALECCSYMSGLTISIR